MRLDRALKDVGGLALYSTGPRLVSRMRRQPLMLLAQTLGDLLYRTAAEDRGIMREELLATVDVGKLREPPDAIVREAFQLRVFNELEVLRYGELGPHNIDATVFLEGREHLDAALAGGKGAIVMIGHYGANQLLMPALGYRGYTIHQLSAPPTAWSSIRTDGRANPIWRLVQERRWELEQHLPAELIDVFGFLRPAYRALEENHVLGLAFDGGGGNRWVPMPLGKRTAWVSTQPWQLARTTGAAIVPAVVVRESRQRLHRVIFSQPFTVARTADREADVRKAASDYGRWFGRQVEKRPAHYLPYLLLRRRVRDTDSRPFFDDYGDVGARGRPER